MKILALVLATAAVVSAAEKIPNPMIDYAGFQKIVRESEAERESHRLTEQQFLTAMADKNVVVLDARSASKYALRHIKGAINLPFTDFTAETLAQVIPAKTTKVLIYCNNNFADDPAAFPGKAISASLNLSTYTSLKSYGYEQVYELGPLLRVANTSIPFEGREVR